MTLSLLVFIAVFVLGVGIGAAAVVFTVRQHRREQVEDQLRARAFVGRQETGVPASATVLGGKGGIVTGGEAGVSGWARVELSLEVTAPGGEPYRATTRWLVEVARMSMLEPGRGLSVRIDQQDPRIIYPDLDWARYLPG